MMAKELLWSDAPLLVWGDGREGQTDTDLIAIVVEDVETGEWHAIFNGSTIGASQPDKELAVEILLSHVCCELFDKEKEA